MKSSPNAGTPRPFPLSKLALAIGIPVVVVLALGAGWWFFIREDNKVQKAAADVSNEVRQAAAATPTTPGQPVPSTFAGSVNVDGKTATPAGSATAAPTGAAASPSSFNGKTYRILDGQSEAWFLAPEKLSRLPTSSVAKGTTKDIKGEFHVTGDGLDASKPTTFTVGLTNLKSDEAQRDRRVRDTLESTKFTTTTFTATKLTGVPAQFTTAESVLQLTGTLDLHGVKKEVTWELKVKKDASSEVLSVLGTTKFKYTDFGMTKPDLAGFVTVEEEVTLQIQLFVAPV